ncbi:MAG: hypothetical protein H6559_18915 [Lewinellaceae bacterium]|nr:hypothetical protein [Lewinellaceae bacterium]
MDSKYRHYQEIYRECPSLPGWMVYREALLVCGGFGQDAYPEDYDLAFRFYKHRLRIAASRDVVHLWRDHPGRASRNVAFYADPTFLSLKMKYFLEIDRRPTRYARPLGCVPQGQGSRPVSGRGRHPLPLGMQYAFQMGKGHLRRPHAGYGKHRPVAQPQVIVLVAAPDASTGHPKAAGTMGLAAGQDYFFFC